VALSSGIEVVFAVDLEQEFCRQTTAATSLQINLLIVILRTANEVGLVALEL